MGLLEAARLAHTVDRAARGVQIGREADAVRDAVTEARRRLRVAEDDRTPGLGVAEQGARPDTQVVPGRVHDGRPLGHMLAEDVRHQQVRALGVAAQGEPEELTQARVADELHAEPLGDPGP